MLLESILSISFVDKSFDERIKELSVSHKFKQIEKFETHTDPETEFLFKKLFEELEKQNPAIKINDYKSF